MHVSSRFIACLLLLLAGCRPDRTAERGRAEVLRPEVNVKARPEFSSNWDKRHFDHGLWDRLLQQHVDDDGLVDYGAFSESPEFEEYLYRLQLTAAAGLDNDSERLAFWINAYNALTIKAVLATLPDDRSRWASYSIQDQAFDDLNIWKAIEFEVGGKTITLDGIENEVLRKQDGLRDPRIHIALVCAAKGCPPLWNRAYTGKQVAEQLKNGLRRFVANPAQCRFDRSGRVIHISRVFDWYKADFTSPGFSPRADSIPAFLADAVVDRDLETELRNETWRLEYNAYDWKLNLQHRNQG